MAALEPDPLDGFLLAMEGPPEYSTNPGAPRNARRRRGAPEATLRIGLGIARASHSPGWVSAHARSVKSPAVRTETELISSRSSPTLELTVAVPAAFPT